MFSAFLKRQLAVIASRTVKDKNGKAMGIQISKVASAKLKELEKEGKMVRLEIDAGGCQGFQYNFSLQDAQIALKSDDLYFA